MNNKMDSANKMINALQASSNSVRNKTKNKEITNTNVDIKSLSFTLVNYATVNVYMLKINLTFTSLNTLFCFFEQEVLLTIVHIGTRRNNNVLPRFFARSPDWRSGWAVGSPRMLGRGKVGQPTTSRIGPKRG
jgi:hypothetical protein